MNDRTLLLLLLCGLCLGACSQLEQRATPTNGAWSGPEAQHGADSTEVLAYFQRIKGLSGDYWVDVVTDPATAATAKRPVTIGMQNKKMTEIVSGLKEGERVLIEAIK